MIESTYSTLNEEAITQQYPDLHNWLIPLLRTKPDDINTYLEIVDCNVCLPSTQTQAHCYFIALDGNKRPRDKDFARFVCSKITDFAIPRVEIKRAIEEDFRNGSTTRASALFMKAKNLFTKLPKSGEGGEVILSILAEAFLQLPQLFTKMILKTNTEMHVHGSDGIHVGVNLNGNLTVYWGESKLHKTPTSAVNDCFSSLSPFLLDSGGSGATQERDLQLMRDGLSLDNPELFEAIKRYLNPSDAMFNKLEYRGLCLVGFDSNSYPTSPNTKEAIEVKREIESAFESNKIHIKNRVIKERIESFFIHIFCLPFPNIDDFRTAFRAELGLINEKS
jgi:hypothetical protein